MDVKKVGFDCSGHDFSDDEWLDLSRQIDASMQAAGLPTLYGDSWRESDGACVFEGASGQVSIIRGILLRYPVTVWEFDENNRPQRIN